MSKRHNQKTSFVVLLFLTTTLIVGFTLAPYSGFASTESNNTLIEPQATQDMGTTTTDNKCHHHHQCHETKYRFSPWCMG